MTDQPIVLDDVIQALAAYHPQADVDLVKKAYLYSNSRHQGQTRYSGEQYIVHPLSVARFVTELKLDEVSIAAALLHDTLEDTVANLSELSELFGQEVADIVQGVTKLSRISLVSREQRQAESFRKMLLAMAKDIRVVLVKLADRVHNMRTLEHTSLEQQQRVSQETLDIYAPLANRLGLYRVKSELEDQSFRYLFPEDYSHIEEKLTSQAEKRGKFLEIVSGILREEMTRAGLEAEIQAREKYKYSIFRKMRAQGVPFEQVFDLVAFRTILQGDLEHCWRVLGIVHQLWKPIPGRFRDFISLPKPNGYRSLHTSVVGPGGEQMEIQIRTRQMHDIAERGIAAHWKYKEGRVVSVADEAKIRYLKQLVEELMDLNDTLRDPMELYSAIREGLSFEEIFVFTPKGEVRELPRQSTPVDFAFSIHSEVGLRCVGAKVNGIMAPLNQPLNSGDVVEIQTSPNQNPSPDWLRFVKSTRAKAKIRGFLRIESRERFQQVGRMLMEKELRRFGLNLNKLMKSRKFLDSLRNMGLEREEYLFAQVGSGKLDAVGMAEKLARALTPAADPPSRPTPPETTPSILTELLNRLKLTGKGKVLVGGHDDVVVRFAKCCNAVPGEPIVGFVTRGRGITVHAGECEFVKMMDKERCVDVEWDVSGDRGRDVSLRVTSAHRPGMLLAMSQVFASLGVNISGVSAKPHEDKADTTFRVEVRNLSQLKSILRALARVDGVYRVERLQK